MNKNTKKLLLKEQRTIDVEFYDNYFISKIKSNTSRSETKINYNDISRVYVDDEFIIVVFNNKYTAVELSQLNENKDLSVYDLLRLDEDRNTTIKSAKYCFSTKYGQECKDGIDSEWEVAYTEENEIKRIRRYFFG